MSQAIKIRENELFERLKKEVQNRFLESNNASVDDISQWKGQDIVNFQEDLMEKTKARVSEKWFYTHFKSNKETLPRIDMLNLLSEYAGYRDWATFCERQNRQEPIDEPAISPTVRRKFSPRIIFMGVGLLVAAVVGYISYWFLTNYSPEEYEFCFIDADNKTRIEQPIEVEIINKGFSSSYAVTRNGCITITSPKDTLKMIVNSNFHRRDTFLINLQAYRGKEDISLEPDDYQLLLYYYSYTSRNMNIEKRRKELERLIAENALIYQVYDNEFYGQEVITRDQYITLLTTLTTSLKNFVLLETERDSNNRYTRIKFKIQLNETLETVD